MPKPAAIQAAMDVIHSTEVPTPLIHSRSLSRRYGRDVFLKLESLSPVRSFKHQGALAADELASALLATEPQARRHEHG